jgi:hypothetical protein
LRGLGGSLCIADVGSCLRSSWWWGRRARDARWLCLRCWSTVGFLGSLGRRLCSTGLSHLLGLRELVLVFFSTSVSSWIRWEGQNRHLRRYYHIHIRLRRHHLRHSCSSHYWYWRESPNNFFGVGRLMPTRILVLGEYACCLIYSRRAEVFLVGSHWKKITNWSGVSIEASCGERRAYSESILSISACEYEAPTIRFGSRSILFFSAELRVLSLLRVRQNGEADLASS